MTLSLSRTRKNLNKETTSIFNPKSISNLFAWFRADLGITLNGSTVSAWADQSSNSRNITQSTALLQPAYVTNAVNGYPIVRFNNSEYLSNLTQFSLTAPFSIFWTLKYKDATNPTDFDYTFSLGFGNGTTGQHLGIARYRDDGSGNASKIYTATREPATTLGIGPAITDTNWRIYGHINKTSAPKSNLEIGAVSQTITDYTATISTTGFLTIGAFNLDSTPTTANFLAGDIHEIVIYNSIPTSNQILKLSRYMANRVSASVA